MPRAAKATFSSVCGHCPWGDHHMCSFENCECYQQFHEPDDNVAMTLMVVARPDLSKELQRDPHAAAQRWVRLVQHLKSNRRKPSEEEIADMIRRRADARRIPEGHREVVIRTGAFNPKDKKDWCYKIYCPCGELDDIAWSYEDAKEIVDDHWTEVLEEEGPSGPAPKKRRRRKTAAVQPPQKKAVQKKPVERLVY